MKRSEILNHLNEFLNVSEIRDYCVNGLQVEGSTEITGIITGVSVSQRLFEVALEKKAEMIIVHHGIFWKGTPHPFALTGIMRDRLKILLTNNINLAAYHLPLDAHPTIGNNAKIMESLGIPKKTTFDVGFMGDYTQPIPIGEFISRLEKILPDPVNHLNYGKQTIKRVAVISGGGSQSVEEAASLGADLFLSGEILEPAVRTSEELGIHVVSAGHYNSERFGPIALADYLRTSVGIPAEFVDIPNPI
jgi:dinuclear metal center YbgI/SA1388 family protein